jgi:hypothetical protein
MADLRRWYHMRIRVTHLRRSRDMRDRTDLPGRADLRRTGNLRWFADLRAGVHVWWMADLSTAAV